MKLVYLLLAAATIFVGLALFPSIRDIIGLIFEHFGGTEGMPPFLTLLVSTWSLLTMAIGFIVGAIFIAKARS